MILRPGGPRDVRFMRDMLRHAYPTVPVGAEEAPNYRYVSGWGRRGDAAVIALDDGNPVGAAWYRLFAADEPGYGFVDEQTPELTIAVVPARRGRGLGGELLNALLDRARGEGYARVSLAVDAQNPSVTLYERHGFRRVGASDGMVTMTKDL